MATAPATANGPIEFTDQNGKQFLIPISALFFDTGTLKTNWPLYQQNKPEIDALLKYLQSSGAVKTAPQPAPVAAMVISAKQPGSAGNDVVINFSNVQPHQNAPTTFDASVTETNTYAGLT